MKLIGTRFEPRPGQLYNNNTTKSEEIAFKPRPGIDYRKPKKTGISEIRTHQCVESNEGLMYTKREALAELFARYAVLIAYLVLL